MDLEMTVAWVRILQGSFRDFECVLLTKIWAEDLSMDGLMSYADH